MVKAVIRGEGFAVEIDASPTEYEAALATTIRAVQASRRSDDALPSPSVLQAVVERLPDEAIEYLRILVEEPEGVSGEDLELMLDLSSRQKLAGLNGSITKSAGSAGLDVDLIEKSVTRTADGKRKYFYKVPPSLRSRMANALPEEPEPTHDFAPPPPSDDDVPF